MRAVAGALFGALPLLFTMEMWWLGRTMTEVEILLVLAAGLPVLVICLLFGGFRRGATGRLRMDVPIILGVGVVVSALTLLVVGQVVPGRTPLALAARVVAVESIPCSIGAALAITQLRPRARRGGADRRMGALSQDAQKVLATVAGGVFFAFNIAPTEEPWKMTIEADPLHFPLVVAFSLVVSYMVVFLCDFAERGPDCREGVLGTPLAETLVCYVIALGVSYGFLLAFGTIGSGTPVAAQLSAMVILGYGTTIGGSAGRVLVAE